MFCISINHKNTPADVRESFAFFDKRTETVHRAAKGCGGWMCRVVDLQQDGNILYG